MALDLKSPEGAEVLTRLVREADVLVENLRPGTLERLGFGYERAAALNPRLIYASVTGYGHTGPRREEAGYDPVLQAEAGLMDITGPAAGEPSRVGVAVTDFLAGQFMFSGILLALRDRDRTGRGQAVDIALFDADPRRDDAAGRHRLRHRPESPAGWATAIRRSRRTRPCTRKTGW